jgi:hypothetical protein
MPFSETLKNTILQANIVPKIHSILQHGYLIVFNGLLTNFVYAGT